VVLNCFCMVLSMAYSDHLYSQPCYKIYVCLLIGAWNMPKCCHLGCFSAYISSFLKKNWGSTTIALFLLEMCFVSYMLFSACGHVGACRSGLFIEAMFLDIVKLNTRLNSISMLKSSVWCHWKGRHSKECDLAALL